jgi:hypothetical protein
MMRAVIFAKMCRLRKTIVLPVCARRLSVIEEGQWRSVGMSCVRLCFHQNGIYESWGRRVLSVIISID